MIGRDVEKPGEEMGGEENRRGYCETDRETLRATCALGRSGP
jgi:hypothetical protein